VTRAATPATVGDSKKLRSDTSTSKLSQMREMIFVASSAYFRERLFRGRARRREGGGAARARVTLEAEFFREGAAADFSAGGLRDVAQELNLARDFEED
jgi:hypothetical protein